MKVSIQFFKDMGVCDGALKFLSDFFDANGIEEADYIWGYNLMQTLPEFYSSAKKGGPDHNTVEGWLKWAYDLRFRPEAIMYFGDHHLADEFRTFDMQIHDSPEAAYRYLDALHSDAKVKYASNLLATGVKIDKFGREVWVRIDDLDEVDETTFDRLLYSKPATGEQLECANLEELREQLQTQWHILEAKLSTQRKIEQRVWSSCWKYDCWIDFAKTDLPSDE